MIPSGVILADGEAPPDNPGVGDEQNLIRAESVIWVMPYGDSLLINEPAGDIFLDWDDVAPETASIPVTGILAFNTLCGTGGGVSGCMVNTEIVDPAEMSPAELIEILGLPVDVGASGYQNDCDAPGNNCEKEDGGVENGGTFFPTNDPTVVIIKAGQGQFIYVDNEIECDPAAMPYCVTWNEDGSITVVRNGSGPDRKEISNIQFWHTPYNPNPLPEPDNNCPDVLVAPGDVTVSGRKIAPTAAVVSGQDPQQTGVTVEWYVSVDPTIVTYETWELLGHEFIACVEGQSDDEDNPCGDGYHALTQEVWGCEEKHISYPEHISELNTVTTLSATSRDWITNDLATYYPGASLIHPDWYTQVPTQCGWAGDTCIITYTDNFKVRDPGTYELKLAGSTSGTMASPPRGFNETAGTLGVYLIENSGVGAPDHRMKTTKPSRSRAFHLSVYL